MNDPAAIFGPLGVASMLLLYALAFVVLRAHPESTSNRRLALVLVLEATAGGFALGLM